MSYFKQQMKNLFWHREPPRRHLPSASAPPPPSSSSTSFSYNSKILARVEEDIDSLRQSRARLLGLYSSEFLSKLFQYTLAAAIALPLLTFAAVFLYWKFVHLHYHHRLDSGNVYDASHFHYVPYVGPLDPDVYNARKHSPQTIRDYPSRMLPPTPPPHASFAWIAFSYFARTVSRFLIALVTAYFPYYSYFSLSLIVPSAFSSIVFVCILSW